MSGLKSIVVAGGSAGLGSFIVKSLLDLKSSTHPEISVYILSRSANFLSVPERLGVDYGSEESIASTLKKVNADVVIAALGSGGLTDVQHTLAKASAKAGVKLFVPSEFGTPTDLDDGKANVFALKAQTADLCKELGLPYLRIFTGGFSEWLINTPLMGLYIKPPKLIILGPGDKPFSLTTRTDIGRFTAYAILNEPLSRLQNWILRIEGDRLTYNDIRAIAEEQFGKDKLEVVQVDKDLTEIKKKLEEEGELGANIFDFLRYRFASGQGTVGDPIDNGLYPDWNPRGFKIVLAEAVKAQKA